MESTGIIIVLGILVAAIVIAKVGMAYLRQVKTETGYNPTGFLNSLMIIGVFVLPLLGGYLAMDLENPLGYGVMIGGPIACIVGLVIRNRVLKDVKKIILVTFFQLLAPMLAFLGIIFKRSGGIMGNAVTQANLSGTNVGGAVHNAVAKSRKSVNEGHYSKAQDALAMDYGYRNAQDAANHGLEMKKYL